MSKKYNHNTLRDVCKKFDVTVTLVVKTIKYKTHKPFVIVYSTEDDVTEQKFLTAFYFNMYLVQMYQLIKLDAIKEYSKFVDNIMREGMDVDVL